MFWVNPKHITQSKPGRYLVTQTCCNKISTYIGNGAIAQKLKSFLIQDRFEPFNVPDFFLRNSKLLKDDPKYFKVQDAIFNKDRIEESAWFNSLERSIETTGKAEHKDIELFSINDIHHFFKDYFFGMVDSMRSDGYRLDKVEDPEDITGVRLGADGRLIKSSGGSHRLYIAQIVGVSSIPVRIHGIHQHILSNLHIYIPHLHINSITEEIKRRVDCLS